MSTWIIDQAHSEIGFRVKHLVISTVRGRFNSFKGTVTTSGDDFSDAKVELSIDTNSITTNNEQRDGHLKSPDFFDVANYPTITFTSTAYAKKGAVHELTGDMTMHGVTKQVVFTVVENGITKDLYGNRVASFEANAVINRMDFDVKWNALIETGGVAVSDEVALELIVEIKEQK